MSNPKHQTEPQVHEIYVQKANTLSEPAQPSQIRLSKPNERTVYDIPTPLISPTLYLEFEPKRKRVKEMPYRFSLGLYKFKVEVNQTSKSRRAHLASTLCRARANRVLGSSK